MKYEPQGGVIRLEEIYEGARARQDYGDVDGLRSTFSSVGQVQSIAVCKRWESEPLPGALFTDKPYELLAGGRRFKALREAGELNVFARIYPVLPEDEKKLIELIENVSRADFTWQEQTKLIAKIQELQQSRLGVGASGAKGGWSSQDTANLLGLSKPTVTIAMQLHQAIKKNPELLKAKTQKDALKIVSNSRLIAAQKELSRRASAELLETQASSTNPMDVLRRNLTKAYKLGDFFEASLAPESFDFIDLDPPYGISLEKSCINSDTKLGSRLSKGDFVDLTPEEFIPFMKKTLERCYSLLKPTGWIICWFPMMHYTKLYELIQQLPGVRCIDIPGVWNKGDSARATADPMHRLGTITETFFYIGKPDSFIVKEARSNCFTYPVPRGDRIHPCQKNTDLMKELLTTFAHPGAQVLVPFVGSGMTLIAAAARKMTPIGFDLSEQFRGAYLYTVAKLSKEEVLGGLND